MARLGGALLKGIGLLVLAVIALSVVWAVVATILGIVATIVQVILTVAVLAVVALVIVGLFSLLSGGDESERGADDWRHAADRDRLRRPEDEDPDWHERIPGLGGDDGGSTERQDPQERLREQYVAGELSEAEFERKMEQLMETDRLEDQLGGTDGSRDRLRER